MNGKSFVSSLAVWFEDVVQLKLRSVLHSLSLNTFLYLHSRLVLEVFKTSLNLAGYKMTINQYIQRENSYVLMSKKSSYYKTIIKPPNKFLEEREMLYSGRIWYSYYIDYINYSLYIHIFKLLNWDKSKKVNKFVTVQIFLHFFSNPKIKPKNKNKLYFLR